MNASLSSNPLESVLYEIERAHESGFYYLALMVALTVPDICSSLEVDLDPVKPWGGIESRYVNWASKYVEPKYSYFTGKDCWALRGGVIHNGRLFGRKDAQVERFIFTTPNPQYSLREALKKPKNGSESVLSLDLVTFCKTMILASREWHEANKDNELVQRNLEHIMRYRSEGISPHIVGLGVVA